MKLQFKVAGAVLHVSACECDFFPLYPHIHPVPKISQAPPLL